LQITKTGFGQPSFFNTEAIVGELVRHGKSLEDARSGGASGCVEAGAFGTEAYILSGYFNLAKVLELTLNNGFDRFTGVQTGIITGDPCAFLHLKNCLLRSKNSLNTWSASRSGEIIQFTGSLPTYAGSLPKSSDR